MAMATEVSVKLQNEVCSMSYLRFMAPNTEGAKRKGDGLKWMTALGIVRKSTVECQVVRKSTVESQTVGSLQWSLR